MTGPLTALCEAYHRRRRWTLDLPHLGIRGCARHTVDPAMLPAPIERDFSLKTKFPFAVGVETMIDGRKTLIPVATLSSPTDGRKLVSDLVHSGVHPLDVIVGEWRGDDNWVYRTAVDHLWWTVEDQRSLEKAETMK
jgi:hypothetical protein